MATLKRASEQLFSRSPDERFQSFQALWEHCQQEKRHSTDVWAPPGSLAPQVVLEKMMIHVYGEQGRYDLNDWSFSQLCRLARVHKETVNRLTGDTAGTETLGRGNKPMQLLTAGKSIRSLHAASYTRLWNADLLSVVAEYATDFQPPPKGCGDATGLYCGEQDLFAFLIDPTGWIEIEGQAFAPGFFLWNSEVGRRSLGIQTFWFQKVCQNHIVWDAVEVVEFTRKHTANVADGLREIRRLIERLAAKRDERRDGFARAITKAMRESFGADAEEAAKLLGSQGLPHGLAAKAAQLARQSGALTIFSVVDALTYLAQETSYAGDRVELDARASSLLALAA